MSPSCRSGNFSSSCLGGAQHCPGSSCSPSCPSTLVPSRDLCSSSHCPRSPSLHSGCQVTCWAPSSCQLSCCSPRVPMLGSPCQTLPPGPLGWGSSSSCSLSSQSSGLRPLGYRAHGVPSLNPGFGFCRPPYGTSRRCQSSCDRLSCGSGFY